MFRVIYHSMNEKLAPSGALERATLDKMEGRPHRPSVRRALTTAVALALVLCLSVTAVAAAVNESFRQLLFGQGAPTAEALTPQTVAVEQDGIRLEVLGSMAGEKNMTVYYTLQDIEGKNRLGKKMNLWYTLYLDGEVVYAPIASPLQNRILDYDPETQTALCRIDMDSSNAQNMEGYANSEYRPAGAQAKLEITNIQRTEHEWEYVPLELEPELNPKTIPINIDNVVLVEEYFDDVLGEAKREEHPFEYYWPAFVDSENNPLALLPGQLGESLLAPEYDVAVSACGYINDKLHIQIKNDDRFIDTDGWLMFMYAEAGNGRNIAGQVQEIIDRTQSGSFPPTRAQDLGFNRLGKMAGTATVNIAESGKEALIEAGTFSKGYSEYVLNISPEEFDQYEFFLRGYTEEQAETDLTVEFPLGDGMPNSMMKCGPMKIGDIEVSSMEFTPITLSVETPLPYVWGDCYPIENVTEIEVICGGKATTFEMMESSYNYRFVDLSDDNWEAFFIKTYTTADAPIDPKTITAIRVNGQEIPLTPAQ